MWEKIKLSLRRFWIFLNSDVKNLLKEYGSGRKSVAASIDSLEEVARKNKAIGISELINVAKCDHSYTTQQQIWVKIAPRRFELRNQDRCVKCQNTRVIAIK